MTHSRLTTLMLLLTLVADITLWLPILIDKKHSSSIAMLDVGQGDATLITFDSGIRLLVDAGGDGRRTVAALESVLPTHMRRIELALITHPQLDHMGGMQDVLRSFAVNLLLINGRMPEDGEAKAAWDALNMLAQAQETHVLFVGEGDRIWTGMRRNAVREALAILSPPIPLLTTGDLNDSSLVFIAELGGYRALFTGDIGIAVEEYLANRYDLRTDVLKIAHHGSRFSTSDIFLSAAIPSVALISAGEGNRYGHPHPDALTRLSGMGIPVYRTDEDGTITVERQESDLVIRTRN